MSEFFFILLSTVLVNNFVLVQFLGLCPFMGVSKQQDTAIGMSLATTFVLTVSSTASYLIYHYVLIPFDLEYLRTIAFILVIAGLVQLIKLLIEAFSPLLHRTLGIYLPLITTNCAVLGVALLIIRLPNSLWQASLYGFGAGLGFSLVLIFFAALRDKSREEKIPACFRGAPIGMITAGLMAMAFMGFNGLV